jgi:hypothetical protein
MHEFLRDGRGNPFASDVLPPGVPATVYWRPIIASLRHHPDPDMLELLREHLLSAGLLPLFAASEFTSARHQATPTQSPARPSPKPALAARPPTRSVSPPAPIRPTAKATTAPAAGTPASRVVPTPPPVVAKGTPMSLASARLTSLALTLARRSPASLRGRAVGAVARAVAADETPKLDDVIETLREIADDESAPDEDRERAKKALIALGQVDEDDEDDDEEKSKRAAKGQARALSPQEQAVFEKGNAALAHAIRRPEDRTAAATARANELARRHGWPEVV